MPSPPRSLLGDAVEPSQVAALAVRALDQLTRHLAPLIGETGVRALLARSAALSGATYPWLAATVPAPPTTDTAWDALRAAIEQQDVEVARDAFVALLSTFVALLGRLIGDGLVQGLLHDIWPDVFSQAVKEAT
jgi:hypothetical protein